MNTAIVIALIALAGSVFSTIVTVFGAPALQARHDAKKALDNYREPLLAVRPQSSAGPVRACAAARRGLDVAAQFRRDQLE